MPKLLALALLICAYLALDGGCLGKQATGQQTGDQATTGTIRGTVTDSRGAAIGGADITVTNTQTRAIFQTKSDDEGKFNVSGLAFGDYELRASAPGLKSMVFLDIWLGKDAWNGRFDASRSVATIDIKM